MNAAIILLVSVGSGLLLVFVVHDLMLFVYKAGYERGRKDAEDAWTKLGLEVDQTRQQIWREEGMNQRGDAA
jgi:hypothetical protein